MTTDSLPSLALGQLSTEMSVLVLAIILGFIQLFLTTHVVTSERGLMWNMGARDETAPLQSKLGGRLDRAFQNFKETFVFFAAAILAAALLGKHNWQTMLGAELYLAGRVIYVPLYALGVPFLRTLVWAAATAGIILILAALVTG